MRGLTDEEAADRLREQRARPSPEPAGAGYFAIALRQVVDPLAGLLAAAAVVAIVVGESLDAAAIAAIVVINAALGFFQEASAERAVRALRASVQPIAIVRRSGRERPVPSSEVVCGDVVVLREGDRVVSDGLLIESFGLEVDESMLTGESVPVAELAPFVVWAMSGGSIPLVITVMQVLALDIGTDLLPALALGAERPQGQLMEEPSRGRTGRLLDAGVLGRAFGFLGPLEAVLSLGLVPLGAALYLGWSPGDALPKGGSELALLSTMVFAAIVCMQMANAFECRSTPASLFSIGALSNRLLVAAVASEVLALAAFVYVPWLSEPLGQRPIGVEWLPVLATPFLLLGAEELRKAVVRRRRPDARPAAVRQPDAREGRAEAETRFVRP